MSQKPKKEKATKVEAEAVKKIEAGEVTSDKFDDEAGEIESPVLEKPKRFVGYHPVTKEKVFL